MLVLTHQVEYGLAWDSTFPSSVCKGCCYLVTILEIGRLWSTVSCCRCVALTGNADICQGSRAKRTSLLSGPKDLIPTGCPQAEGVLSPWLHTFHPRGAVAHTLRSSALEQHAYLHQGHVQEYLWQHRLWKQKSRNPKIIIVERINKLYPSNGLLNRSENGI